MASLSFEEFRKKYKEQYEKIYYHEGGSIQKTIDDEEILKLFLAFVVVNEWQQKEERRAKRGRYNG